MVLIGSEYIPQTTTTSMVNVSETADVLNNDMGACVLPVTVFIVIETVFGFFGNIVILLVYFKRYRRINFRYFVLALAKVDLTSCCTVLPGEIFSQLNCYAYAHEWTCKVKSFFVVFTAWGSASILLIVAVDRYRKICHPFHWQIRYNVAFRICVCCFLMSSLVSSPIPLLWGKVTYKNEINTASFCENSVYRQVFLRYVYFLPISVMTIVAMTLNFITARKVFKGHSATLANAKSISANIGTSTVMTSESLDKVTDDEAGACKNKADKGTQVSKQIDKLKGTTNKCRIKNNFELSVFNMEPGLNEQRLIKNDIGDEVSKGEEISVASNGNRQNEDNSSEHGTTVTSCKSYTLKFRSYRKSKTMIMLVLTSIFAVTMALYIILSSFVGKTFGILKYKSDAEKAVFVFFWRLYFVNSVFNPIVYGFMDARFRLRLISYLPKKRRNTTSLS